MNNHETIIYAPNLYLFAFALAKATDYQWQTVKCDRQWLIKSYQEIIANFPEFKPQFQAEFIRELREDEPEELNLNLLNPDKFPSQNFLALSQQQLPEVALIYPRKIADSYGLMLSLYHPQNFRKDAVPISKLTKFNPNNCLNIHAYLGKTLLFYAFITLEQLSNIEQIARECVDKIIPSEKQPPLLRQDILFNSRLFVYSNPKVDYSESYQQVLILFFTKEENNEKFIKAYLTNLPSLLLDFHKILKAYYLGKEQYQLADRQINALGKILETLNEKHQLETKENLSPLSPDELKELKSKLKKLLRISLEYSQIMRKIEHYQNTLNINFYNYQIDLKNLQQETSDRLDYFVYLKDRQLPSLQRELEAKFRYASQGSILIEEAIATIRGLVEINQAEIDRQMQQLKEQEAQQKEKSDRKFQIILAATGAGFAVSGVVGEGLGQITPENPLYFPWQPEASHQFHPFTEFVFISIVSGLLAALIAGLIVYFWKN